MASEHIANYRFDQSKVAIEAFIGYFEKRVQFIHPELPVFVLMGNDETYIVKKKFEKTENKEVYLKTPRITFKIEEFSLELDQNTSQYIRYQYHMDNSNYTVEGRRQATIIPIACNFVTPNMVRGMEYFEMLASLLSIDNTFTYEHLGSTHEASFSSTNFSFEDVPSGQSSESRNFVVKCSINLNIQLMLVKYHTIKKVDAFDNAPVQTVFEIRAKGDDGSTYDTTVTNPNDNCE